MADRHRRLPPQRGPGRQAMGRVVKLSVPITATEEAMARACTDMYYERDQQVALELVEILVAYEPELVAFTHALAAICMLVTLPDPRTKAPRLLTLEQTDELWAYTQSTLPSGDMPTAPQILTWICKALNA